MAAIMTRVTLHVVEAGLVDTDVAAIRRPNAGT
jgi:hypothetical protein